MKEEFDVLVIGAGPAGSAASLLLARAGWRVLLSERGPLPRHRLCGEFLSPEAVADLARLGLDPRDAGAQPIHTARVAGGGRSAETTLVPPGFGISRSILDAWLAQAAVATGAELRTGCPVGAIEGSLQAGFNAEIGRRLKAEVSARAVLGAYGKRTSPFARELRAQPALPESPRWVALKAQCEAVDLPARVELHALPGGYVGAAPIGGGRANVCAVVAADALPRGPIGGALGALRMLAKRTGTFALPITDVDSDSVQAESGAEFGTAAPLAGDVLLAGDAAALPHPLGGDGMAMALRAGLLAARHLDAFLSGRTPAAEVGPRYERAWRREFVSRLRWNRWFHGMLVRPAVAGSVLAVLGSWPAGMRFAVDRTRGAELAKEAVGWQRSE